MATKEELVASRSGWSDLTGAPSFDSNGATILGTGRKSSNLQISCQTKVAQVRAVLEE